MNFNCFGKQIKSFVMKWTIKKGDWKIRSFPIVSTEPLKSENEKLNRDFVT